MATGKQMLEAVRTAIESQPGIKELRLSVFDAYDLFKLMPGDLQDFGIDVEHAELISGDLFDGSLTKEYVS